ncbi:hypothetical protein CH304_00345 [Rhodococcus sp. 15-649-1-2]|nr:bifunctional DNA primase/polymerase [Rhodococcus sp. 15-649-1-2]OZE88054.1 hypothetical protein CH304_00345 [Rhodococcus sp. 15-649-1-2]
MNPETTTPNPDLYATHAPQYWNAGWRSILPMRPATKWPPPTGYTGYDGTTPSYPDIQTWTETRPDANIALRLPPTLIGIDVDAYGTKTGGATLRYAETLWGKLPPTTRSTSRDDNISGIRLYQVPENTHLATVLGFPDLHIGHIEIIQYFHRYAVAYPSIHPEGGTYHWLDEQGFHTDIPAVDDLPPLPDRWLTELTAAANPTTLDDVDVHAALANLPAGDMDTAVATRLADAVKQLETGTTATSRHDLTLSHVMAFLRYAEQHHPGIQTALTTLGSAFVTAVTQDGSRTPDDARNEYHRMVTGHRAHALIAATPTISLEQLAGLQPKARDREPADDPESERNPVGDPKVDPKDEELPPDAIWQQRDSLEHIQQFAYARMCSPWAVLGVCLARALTTVPPWITLPPIIGGRGSLNYFVALVGPSGTGKGAAEAVGTEIINADIHASPAGSGEGLAHQYVHIEKKELIRDRNAVLFSIPEIDTLMSVGNRTGSTILSKLRSAFSGEEIGFSYADPTKRLLVGAHNYRLTLIMGVQPEKAGPLLGDSGGGTPQRFLWLPSTDPGISTMRPTAPGPLTIPETKNWVGRPKTLTIPETVETTLLNEHVKRSRGEGDALDGHALFVREKTAMALALLDNRMDMNDDDWELSGLVMAKSAETRALIDRALTEVHARQDTETGQSAGRVRLALDDTVTETRIRNVGQRIIANLDKHGPETIGASSHRIWSKHRDYYDDALKAQIIAGNVVVEDGVLKLSGAVS